MKITDRMFRKATGRDPEQDDLERCNCPDAGKPGHVSCGWCEHNKPVFECQECFHNRVAQAYSRLDK